MQAHSHKNYRAAADLLDTLKTIRLNNTGQLAERFITLGRAGVLAVAAHFPGEYKAPPRGPYRLPVELDPLLALACRFGKHALPMLSAHLRSPDKHARAGAVVVIAAQGDADGLALLPHCVLDESTAVRGLALQAIIKSQNGDVVGTARHLCTEALKSGAPDVQQRALVATAELRAIAAIPAVIELLEHSHLNEAAHECLVRLMFIDCGRRARKWRELWESLRRVPECRWLIMALASHDAERQRLAHAHAALQQGAHADRGYLPTSSDSSRLAAIERWKQGSLGLPSPVYSRLP